MCLSTIYKNEKAEENVLCKFVSSIKAEGDALVFTDIMGTVTRIEGGRLVAADLTAGTVIISAQ